MSYQSESSHQGFRWNYDEFDDSNFEIHGRTLFFIIALFSVILLVTLLFLYARWVCRFSSSSAPPRGVHPPLRARGLDSATINNLQIVLYKASGNFSEAECCICLGIFGDKEEVKVLPACRHCFHSECVDKWLSGHSSCPLCRAPIQVDPLV
ncbi:hypothetical protein ACJIZ3_009560 [Penstemon smallii]|uniref:RING-type domain-containing protein n=1 Tax=Penstemon smallii TaxID=265156 RepID=A0ABD3TCV8_9LAMI